MYRSWLPRAVHTNAHAARALSRSLAFFPRRPLLNALLSAPAHYVLETLLLLIIAYIVLFKQAYDPSKKCAEGEGGRQEERRRRACRKARTAS